MIEGRWDGNWSQGQSPAAWKRADTLLEVYLSTGRAVRYGQCFVYSGVLTALVSDSPLCFGPFRMSFCTMELSRLSYYREKTCKSKSLDVLDPFRTPFLKTFHILLDLFRTVWTFLDPHGTVWTFLILTCVFCTIGSSSWVWRSECVLFWRQF